MYKINHWINVPVDIEAFEISKDVLEETIKILEEGNLGCAQEPQRMWALKGVLYFYRDLINPNTSYEHLK
tara:strand:- start:77 stop:286 length:210 start_codon:yes stop_codon:yes gene_type:complete